MVFVAMNDEQFNQLKEWKKAHELRADEARGNAVDEYFYYYSLSLCEFSVCLSLEVGDSFGKLR